MKKLKRVFVEITNRCNLSCSFCPGTKRPKRNMSKTDFQKVVREVKSVADEIVLHVMGEPLLHPNLLEFIDCALEGGLTVMITTNGVLLSGKLAEQLATKKLRQINISLHAADELRKKDEYLERITSFVHLAERENPEGYINLRLWDGKTRPKRKNIRVHGRVYLNLDERFDWPDIALPVLRREGSCYGLRTHCGVLVDGSVVPCCLDGEGTILLGNIHERPLVEILGSDRAQKMIRGFERRKLVEPLCQRCGYVGRFAAQRSD